MPHKDREKRLAYIRQHHAINRPSPKPLPQADGGLPPHGQIITDDDGGRIQCHACGKFLGSLTYHIGKMHGLSADAYKERYGLARGASLISPHCAELQRQAAIARDQGSQGIQFGRDKPVPSRKGLDNRLGSRVSISEGHRKYP